MSQRAKMEDPICVYSYDFLESMVLKSLDLLSGCVRLEVGACFSINRYIRTNMTICADKNINKTNLNLK